MGAARPRVTIVIPAYRNTGLRACLDGIAALDRSVPFETIVVLNDATDEVRAIAGEYSGEVQLADIPVNLGVSGAFNHGFALGTGEYLLQLQDDSIPGPDLITALVARAEAVPDAGAIGALALNHDDEVLDPGMVVWRSGLTCAGLINGSRRPDDYVESRAVDYHGSVGMLIRRTAWESVGGLDDAFYPAYYGDVDLCFRLRERGWRVLVEPRAHVRHIGAASTALGFRQFLTLNLRERFINRHEAALRRHGEADSSPAAVDVEVARAAAVPPGPPPAPATPSERALLRTRLNFSAVEVAKRERDVRAAYAEHLAHTHTAEAERLVERIAVLESERAADEQRLTGFRAEMIETAEALARARAELQVVHLALQGALHDLDQMSSSRSWRFTRWLRR
ncbi:MAG: glycosyltransferase [Thermoleophilia bacterium]